jgi:hypothetical protein
VPWERLSLAIFIPLLIRRSMTVAVPVAGPMVHTILVMVLLTGMIFNRVVSEYGVPFGACLQSGPDSPTPRQKRVATKRERIGKFVNRENLEGFSPGGSVREMNTI